MKRFNVTGVCFPEDHYMVDISSKLVKIKEMVDEGLYFTINRARQYGKTTTLSLLYKYLKDEYIVIRMSFEGVGSKMFEKEEYFCIAFTEMIQDALSYTSVSKQYADDWLNDTAATFKLLSKHITKMCTGRKVVLIIDEVDKASNNGIFINFLGMLRDKYQLRKDAHTFKSVILAGVHDVKNLKKKMTREGIYIQNAIEGGFNSPWNIAADFEIDMSFDSDEIASMLMEYEKYNNIGMDIHMISEEIYKYTGGYPYLVSRICQHIDKKLDRDWTIKGVKRAIKLLLEEKNTLFDDLSKNLENNHELYNFVYELLVVGDAKTFSSDNPLINDGVMFGYLLNNKGKAVISNKIFEIRITNYFISKDESKSTRRNISGILQYDIVQNDKFNMELCLRKFAEHYKEICNPNNDEDIEFLERHGRLVFLSYLKPLINGKGFYHIESQFTDLRRMDVVVDYGRDQFIIELKRWKGSSSHNEAYEQLIGYLNHKNITTGYLLTFDFRKSASKEFKAEWIQIGGINIFDVIV